ncbi:MAG: nucleoside deaminase [Gammaproteobacteria bacterium]|nr:nucleoside deaminase [Gammaproteobacteria bacterium]MYF01733.1 nucleoside deaminase [Gammaproteobacteria bacterium]MYI76713.1 nucleoside deaminase [Gammaproteobacteria bacterium]
MHQALALAREAQVAGEVPVGAIVVLEDAVVGKGVNRSIQNKDPTAHAECEALRDAARRLGNYRLPGTTVFVTVEPCMMCVGAMVHARVSQLVFGTREPKSGVIVSNVQALQLPHWNHTIEYTEGILSKESKQLMQEFFRSRRVA